ncbi:MAG: SRPBCC family protein [Actinobacteria bacterium]|nr:SRPBCC family protein [Actinomycetota bacterium]
MPIEAAGSIYIDRPPEDVFALLTDLNRLHEWLVGCSKAFPVEGPPDKVGSVVGHNNDLLGRAFESRYEITKWEPAKSISSNAIKGPFSGVSEEEFQKQNGGTLFSARVTGNLRGPFRALDRAARRVAQSQLDTSLLNAKEFVESSIPASKA